MIQILPAMHALSGLQEKKKQSSINSDWRSTMSTNTTNASPVVRSIENIGKVLGGIIGGLLLLTLLAVIAVLVIGFAAI